MPVAAPGTEKNTEQTMVHDNDDDDDVLDDHAGRKFTSTINSV